MRTACVRSFAQCRMSLLHHTLHSTGAILTLIYEPTLIFDPTLLKIDFLASDESIIELRTKAALEVRRALVGERLRNCVNKHLLRVQTNQLQQ